MTTEQGKDFMRRFLDASIAKDSTAVIQRPFSVLASRMPFAQ